MKMWMIRHADLTISRPIPEPLLVSKIESGSIDRSDEICLSGSYWFSVQDVAEVRKFLGEIDLIALMGSRSADDATSAAGAEKTRTDHQVAIELSFPDAGAASGGVDEKTPVPQAAASEGASVAGGTGTSVVSTTVVSTAVVSTAASAAVPQAGSPAAVFPNQGQVRSPAPAPERTPQARMSGGVNDADGSAAPAAQILLIVALVVIFCGTIALLWIASR